mgnify:CR=1 FL=1
MQESLLILTATYNEAGNVERLAEEAMRAAPHAHVLFVDDNSPDGTGAVLDRLAGRDSRVKVIHRPGKLGVGSAHADGIRWARKQGYKIVVTLDCDFTHSPEDIPKLLALSEACDLVVASRHMKGGGLAGWRLHRRVLTKAAHAATSLLLGMPYDATSSFRLYRLDRIAPELLERVRSRGYSFFLESLQVLHSNGVQIRETPVSLRARSQGRSKMRFADGWQSVRTLLRLFWSRTGLKS